MTNAGPVGRRLLGPHPRLYGRTGGPLGHRPTGMPCLRLRTVGRRSGMPRSTVLVYARDGVAWRVAASNDGAGHHSPDWLQSARPARGGDPGHYPALYRCHRTEGARQRGQPRLICPFG
ncbi:nitroreductase/quinone reductase family protein [Streptomyces sp. NPDC006476]|uniref:nitroreductase/quinone reductase family protein n=1 Tax=Streptomyces sp. NPDC006476 TaxID=3157175 RepID=UPI0033A5EBCE